MTAEVWYGKMKSGGPHLGGGIQREKNVGSVTHTAVFMSWRAELLSSLPNDLRPVRGVMEEKTRWSDVE